MKRIKNFFGEFKKFITRGNVLDMAVGVIIGGAFTAIVNGLSNFILKPIINWIIWLIIGGDGGLESIVYFLKKVEVDGVVDMANSIYIDWGSFISAVINFFLVALVLFLIIRAINRASAAREERYGEEARAMRKAVRKIRKEEKVKWEAALIIYAERKAAEKAEAEAAAKAEAEEAEAKAAEEARLAEEKEMAPTRLLEEIRDLLKNSK